MVRMRRNKEQDWIRVLQERLQDAALPLENDFAAFSGVGGQPAARRTVWWPWALAGAAAALAAVLLLRPAPEGVNPVQGGDSLIAQNDIAVPSEVAETGLGAPVGNDAGGRRVAPGEHFRSEARTIPSAPQGQARRRPQDMEPEPPAAGVPAEEIPDQVGNDSKVGKDREIANDGRADNDGRIQDDSRAGEDSRTADSGPVTSLGELAQAGLPEEPEESKRAARRPRLTLHLQASSGGTSGSGGWGQKPMALAWSENRTEIHLQPGHPIYSDAVPQHSYGQGIPGINSSGNTGDVYLMEVINSQTVYHTVSPAPAFPVSFGLSGELAFGRRWSLLSGLEYTQRAGYRMNGGIPQALTLHYLGVPLETRFHFLPEQRFRLYLGAGLKAEKCLWTKGGEPLKDPVLFSWNLQAGADFRLVPGVRIYLAPVVSQYLNRSAYANGWDEKPQFSLRAGLSFDL